MCFFICTNSEANCKLRTLYMFINVYFSKDPKPYLNINNLNLFSILCPYPQNPFSVSLFQTFHKECFKCSGCNKGLDSISCCEGPDKDIYCRGAPKSHNHSIICIHINSLSTHFDILTIKSLTNVLR